MKQVAFVLVFVLVTSAAYSSDLHNIVAYRDVDGKFTETSVIGLRDLENAAIRNGSVGVWVTFNMVFEGTPALRTPSVIQSEAEEKARLIEQVIKPIGRNAIVLETPQGLEEAPGCLVNVTAQGLKRLAKSQFVKHISYYSL